MSATEDFKTLVMNSDVGSTMISLGGKGPTGSFVGGGNGVILEHIRIS